MLHWRIACANASEQPSIVIQTHPDDVPSLEQRGANWWHVWMGITLPLIAEMDRSGLCTCRGADGCTCTCAHLIAPRVSTALLGKQLSILRHAEQVDLPPPAAAATVATLRRCDELLDRGRGNAMARGAASYFEACVIERPWVSVRHIIGGLAGADLASLHPRHDRTLLVVTRKECDAVQRAKHLHRAICLSKEDASTLTKLWPSSMAASVASFEALPFAEQVQAVAGARVVLLVHGAALANLWFARRDSHLVELTPYVLDEAGENQQQELEVGRDAGQRLATTLTTEGIPVTHVAVPVTPRGVDGCGAWGCFDESRLGRVLHAHARPLAPVPIEVTVDAGGDGLVVSPTPEAMDSVQIAAALVLACLVAAREPPPDWSSPGPCHASHTLSTGKRARVANGTEIAAALRTGADAAVDGSCAAAQARPIGTRDVPLLLRTQKTGSTTMRRVWERHRPTRSSEEDLSISCHLSFRRLQQMVAAPMRPWIVVLVREPVSRVWSEYRMCVATSACSEQLQWDYRSVSPVLAQRLALHRRGERALPFNEFVEWRPNPAHNRQAEYISGRRYARDGSSLRLAFRNLCRAGAVVPLAADAPADALRGLGTQLGWRLDQMDLGVHERGGGGRASHERAAAADGPFAHLIREPPDAPTRARLLELNTVDALLWKRAREIVASARRVPVKEVG